MYNNKRSYNNGGGGRGYNGGGGRGRGGRYPGSNAQKPTEVQVLTNQNRLLFSFDHASNESAYVQCEVSIKNAWYKKVTDETTGEERRVFETKDITDAALDKFLRKPLPWRIMKKFGNENNIEVAYDGNRKAIFPSAASTPKDDQIFEVKVKRDCEEDDPDAARMTSKGFPLMRSQLFAVSFRKTNIIPLQAGMPSEELLTASTVILKSAAVMTCGMISLEPNSPVVYFPLDKQHELLNDRRLDKGTRDGTKIFLSGLKMTTVSQKDGTYVQTENVSNYANKEHFEILQSAQRHRDGASRVPLLNTIKSTIAGKRIDDVRRPITRASQREEIEEAIRKLDITVEYVSDMPGKESRTIIYKNKHIGKDDRSEDPSSQGHGKRIIWSASDATQFSFEHNGQQTTVASFFENVHGRKLMYPNMPIIFIPNISKHGGGWFPIELVFQAFAKSKENSEEMVNNILKYHDVYAGKRYVDEVNAKLERLSITGDDGAKFQDRLSRWGITIDNRPVQVKAKVLQDPIIKFKNTKEKADNGSFNLRNVEFSRPAKLASFAVLNFTNDRNSCRNFVKTVVRVARSHGIGIPTMIMDMCKDDRYLDLVTFHYRGRDAVADALDVASQAIQKARNFYLYDEHRFYRDRNEFFRTHCYSEQQEEFECLVLPPTSKEEPLGLLLDYNAASRTAQYHSHRIEDHVGNVYEARLMVKISETNTLIDPLDFRFHDGYPEASRRDGSWQKVTFVDFCYWCPEQNQELREQDVRSKQFMHLAADWEVDFPSIVFAYLPDDGKKLYDRIKVMSNHFGGIQSQCAVKPKFEKQGNRKDQYASNIATKINAKLSTIYDKAISWESKCGEGDGGDAPLPWVGDVPTLVIGVGSAHGMGRSSKSVVAASVCLDSGCMRLSHSCFIQNKSDTISHLVMKDIIKVSIDHYRIENNRVPKRILFYRDGMSDGQMKCTDEEIKGDQPSRVDCEIASIKEAVNEKLGGLDIPITFVVCQSNSGFRMVPAVKLVNSRGRDMDNVYSGTSVEGGDNSFFLVAQGGMKGTSKPVKHIVYLNENKGPVDGHCGLTLQNVMNLTNKMSWTYPTATKAVREVPAIKYAKRLANQVLASLLCLEAGCSWFGKDTRLICPEDDFGTEEEKRSYLEMNNANGELRRKYNIVENPFRNHLAA